MKAYVLGFLFFKYDCTVWLIEKIKPEWQAGKLNGIGGKIELNELPIDAMKREFKEEAGLTIDDWKWYGTITDDKTYEVYCYYSYSHELPTTMTEEKIFPIDRNNLPNEVIPNLNWLIPMALSFDKGEKTERFHIKEMYKVD